MSKKSIIKTPEQIAHIRVSGELLTQLLLDVREMIVPGATGEELETYAQSFMDKHKVVGAFKGFEGFPSNLCVSINDCIVHGVPDAVPFKKGDVVKVDAGVIYQGGISDSAFTHIVGDEGDDFSHHKGMHLLETTKGALDHGLSVVKPGLSLFKWGKAVYEYVHSRNCSIIKNLTGHGVGVEVHEGPAIFNWPNGGMQKYTFEPGMVVALEPITALKSTSFVEKSGVARNLYTKKGDIGAQWEYTVLITNDGYEILAGIR